LLRSRFVSVETGCRLCGAKIVYQDIISNLRFPDRNLLEKLGILADTPT